MRKKTTEFANEQPSRTRLLLKIMLRLVDDYRPADGISMSEVLRIVRDRLIEIALEASGGNITAAAENLGMKRTALEEVARRQERTGARRFERRRNRKKPTVQPPPPDHDEEE